MTNLNDEELIAKIAAGDKVAMRAFYERHAAGLRAFIRARLDDPIETADVLHDAMLEVWRAAGRFAGQSTVRSWLFAIARNKAVDRVRRAAARGAEQPIDDMEIADGGVDAEAALAAAETAAAVRRCLDGLSPSHRAALHLAFFEDLSYPQVAEVEGVPVGTIKTRVHHAKKLMMRCLGGGAPAGTAADAAPGA